MIKKIKALILGMREFRQSFTTHLEDDYWYECGREFAHVVTLRRFED
jgi:hypothetical protein